MTKTSATEQPFAQEKPGVQDFSAIQKLIGPESAAMDKLIIRELSSDVVLINQIGHYIVNSGGKRLRPMLMVLAAKALGYTGNAHIILSAVIEFIHTATLLHDDVVDESSQRRGQDTANTIWGNSASVLVGDFLYSRAFEIMVRLGSLRIMEILSSTTTAIAEGEVLQLLNCNNPSTTEQQYLEVIARKTAILFCAATQLAAVISDANQTVELGLREYGLRVGIAFQLVDDLLDYRADPEELGKNLGDDLADGKPTLPLIYALEHANEEQVAFLRTTIENGTRENIKEVFAIMQSTDALSYTARRAREEADKAIVALDYLPDSEYKAALISLALFSVERSY